MNEAELDHFRRLAEAMQTEPTDWQWIGNHDSQRLFGVTEHRAKLYASLHGGTAKKMPTPEEEAAERMTTTINELARQLLKNPDAALMLTSSEKAAIVGAALLLENGATTLTFTRKPK